MSAAVAAMLEGMPGPRDLRMREHGGRCVITAGRVVLFEYAAVDVTMRNIALAALRHATRHPPHHLPAHPATRHLTPDAQPSPGDLGLYRFTADGEDFQSHVAAGFGPFVVLLGQHRADQADDRVAAGEDADHVGAAPDLLVQPLESLLTSIVRGARESLRITSAHLVAK